MPSADTPPSSGRQPRSHRRVVAGVVVLSVTVFAAWSVLNPGTVAPPSAITTRFAVVAGRKTSSALLRPPSYSNEVAAAAQEDALTTTTASSSEARSYNPQREYSGYWPEGAQWASDLTVLKYKYDGEKCVLENTKDKLAVDAERDPMAPNRHTIRLPKRPFYLATPDNKCPHVDNLDAGACVGLGNHHAQADHSKFGCLPSFLIIGTMKGGTAELQGWLSNHPNLHRWGGDSKNGAGEAHFFDHLDSRKDMRERWVKDYLLGGFRMSDVKELEEEYTFEKTPKYLSSDITNIKLMHKFLPSAKLVAILRKPSSRAYSHYQHKCRQGRVFRVSPNSASSVAGAVVTSSSAEKAFASLQKYGHSRLKVKELVQMESPCSPEDFDAMLHRNLTSGERNDKIASDELADGGILSRGLYSVHINNFLRFFQRDQLLLLLTEEMFAGTIDMMNRIQSFLGLPFFDYTPHAVVNERGFTVFKGMSSKANKMSYDPMLPSTKASLEAYYRPFNRDLTRMVEPQRIARYWYDPALDDPLELEISEAMQYDED